MCLKILETCMGTTENRQKNKKHLWHDICINIQIFYKKNSSLSVFQRFIRLCLFTGIEKWTKTHFGIFSFGNRQIIIFFSQKFQKFDKNLKCLALYREGKKKQPKVFYDISASFGRTAKLKILEYAPKSELFFGKIFEVAQLL